MKTNRSAFTMVELLVVVAIIAIIATFLVPAATSMLRGTNLTRGGMMVEQALTRARQMALAQNRKSEVRFYKFDDPQLPGTAKSYRAVQIFQIEDNGKSTAMGKVATFPESVSINESSALSPLIKDGPSVTGTDKVNLPRVGSSYDAVYVRFQPDGSTTLDPAGGESGKWFLTLHEENHSVTNAKPPANYYTVQIDPLVGTIRTLRP